MAQCNLGGMATDSHAHRPKGSMPSFKTKAGKQSQAGHSRLQIRKLANFVGRIDEILWRRRHGCKDFALEQNRRPGNHGPPVSQ